VTLLGHYIGETLHVFPHRCPGEGCAIQRWLTQRHGAKEVWNTKQKSDEMTRNCSEKMVESGHEERR
jgi:hypothetical protein